MAWSFGRVVILSAVMAAAGACGLEAGQGGERGTIAGQVTRGPIMPVCREGVPCDGPFAGAKVIVRGAGGGEARAVADEAGAFRVDVAAGHYTVGVEVEGMLPHCQQVDVTVVASETARADIGCDTGIR